MLRYEILILTIPEITQDEGKTVESSIDKVIKNGGGVTVSFERWGKYRLAYPVKKNDYGIYSLVRFEVDNAQEILKALRSLFAIKLNNIVMRNMVSVLDPQASLKYVRPQSLEEAPARDVDSFLRKDSSSRRREEPARALEPVFTGQAKEVDVKKEDSLPVKEDQ